MRSTQSAHDRPNQRAIGPGNVRSASPACYLTYHRAICQFGVRSALRLPIRQSGVRAALLPSDPPLRRAIRLVTTRSNSPACDRGIQCSIRQSRVVSTYIVVRNFPPDISQPSRSAATPRSSSTAHFRPAATSYTNTHTHTTVS